MANSIAEQERKKLKASLEAAIEVDDERKFEIVSLYTKNVLEIEEMELKIQKLKNKNKNLEKKVPDLKNVEGNLNKIFNGRYFPVGEGTDLKYLAGKNGLDAKEQFDKKKTAEEENAKKMKTLKASAMKT